MACLVSGPATVTTRRPESAGATFSTLPTTSFTVPPAGRIARSMTDIV